jgi:NitT/TauT family transport system substrate-binding protein
VSCLKNSRWEKILTLKKWSCEKSKKPLKTFVKSPLTPPFDCAQGMLFQRGELKTEVLLSIGLEKFSSLVSDLVNIPLCQKGDKGGFERDFRYRAVKILLASFLAIVALPHPAEARKVPVAVPDLSTSLIAFVVAKEKHFYEEEGLDVELIKMSAPLANLALIGGNVAFGAAGAAAIPSVMRGAPLRFLFHTYYRPIYWLYAQPEIRDLRGLKDKKVGVSGIGSGPDLLLHEFLKKNGLEGGRDVAILALGVGTARFFALKAGFVDAAMLSPPSNFLAEEAGFRQLVSFVKEDLVDLQSAVVVREGAPQSDPGLVEKFLRGTLKGFFYARDNRAGTVPILARVQNIKEDLAAKTYDVSRPAMTADGTVSDEILKRTLDQTVARLGLKEAPSSFLKLFDYSLTRRIRAELETQGWKPKD